MKKLGVCGPQKAPTKVRVSLRLSRDVVEYFRATGDGWQTRMDSELLEMVQKHKVGQGRIAPEDTLQLIPPRPAATGSGS